MKALAIINQSIKDEAMSQWQYDKIMAAIAFDLEVTVVFTGAGIEQIHHNKSWKSLPMFGVDNIYCLSPDSFNNSDPLLQADEINTEQLRRLIVEAETIL